MLTPHQTTVVQEKLQQHQVISAQMTTQEEITPQSAVEVLDHTAGTHYLAQQLRHRLTQHPVSTTPTLPQRLLPLPTLWPLGRQRQHLAGFFDRRRGNSEFLGQSLEILVELLGKGQQILPLTV